VAGRFGSVDVSFNLISVNDVQGTPLVEMSLRDYEMPIVTALRSTFITTRAAARRMIGQGSGVILMFGGDGGRDPIRHYSIGGFQVALNAVDAMRRQLAAELGEHGVRVLTIHTGGVLETLPKDFPDRQVIEEMIVGPTMLGRAATLEDAGNVAVFAASDLAASITGTALNITCGAVAD
jgi:NAD(P)-dependent dehydrogenase (short-subunit alcohol dehydrogenase family)